MKNKVTSKFLFVLILSLVVSSSLAMPGVNVKAQTPIQIVGTTIPIDADLRAKVESWLNANPPNDDIYYAITYTQPYGFEDYYVSLVALHLQAPDESWTFSGDEETGENKVSWFGTILLHPDGSAEIFSTSNSEIGNVGKLASPALPAPIAGAGGGAYVRFPWQPSKGVIYGILGVHGAGYSLGGDWNAVDLVSGSDMGIGAANDLVYASVTGTVDYVCQDSDSTAIKVSGSGDEFLYAHILDNANLSIGHTFAAGGVIGSLKHGSFGNPFAGCGYAVQTAEHWHLHWGFKMSNNRFQAEGCFLSKTPALNYLWTCGTTKIKINDMLSHYGNIPGNDSGSQINEMNFFTFLLRGAKGLWDWGIKSTLPEHNDIMKTFFDPLLGSIKVVFRIAYILLKGNFNMKPAVAMILATIGIRVAFWVFVQAISLVKMLKLIPIIMGA